MDINWLVHCVRQLMWSLSIGHRAEFVQSTKFNGKKKCLNWGNFASKIVGHLYFSYTHINNLVLFYSCNDFWVSDTCVTIDCAVHTPCLRLHRKLIWTAYVREKGRDLTKNIKIKKKYEKYSLGPFPGRGWLQFHHQHKMVIPRFQIISTIYCYQRWFMMLFHKLIEKKSY